MIKVGIAECEVVFFATPNGITMQQARDLLTAGAVRSMNVMFCLPEASTLNIVPLLH